MPSIKPQIKAITDTVTYEKIKYVAEKENRSVSNLIETLVKIKIESFESEHGEIPLPEDK